MTLTTCVLAVALLLGHSARAQVANDTCDSAILVTEATPAAEGSNALASRTDDATATCQLSQADVWFEYVATCTGETTVDTFGSLQEDTVLSVLDGCGGTELACDDDTGGLHSQVVFWSVAGQSYRIRLASYGVPGDYDLNIACIGVAGNDTCATALAVSNGAPATAGNNSQASATDDGTASCQISQADVWFVYTATCTGKATVDTFGSGQEDTVLSVYDACAGNEIACDDDSAGGLHAQASFSCASGDSYWIRLASFGVPGEYVLNIVCSDLPSNDDCAVALAVTNGTPAAQGSNALASLTDDGFASCQLSQSDVWFEYVATCSSLATVDSFGSGQEDTVLSVYDACGGNEIACNDDFGGGDLHAQVSFAVLAGQSYWIRLASHGVPGDYELNIDCVEAITLFIRGDANADGNVDVSDGIFTLGFLFSDGGTPGCLDAADANDDGTVDIADAIFTYAYLFTEGPTMPSPTAECGSDDTADALDCQLYPPCAG